MPLDYYICVIVSNCTWAAYTFGALLREFFDSTLNPKVQHACGGSNRTLGRRVNNLSAQILNGLFDRRGRYAVALA